MTGLRAAYELGLSHALQLDSDGQHCWDDIPKFIEQSHQHPDAMVIGQPYFDASIPKSAYMAVTLPILGLVKQFVF